MPASLATGLALRPCYGTAMASPSTPHTRPLRVFPALLLACPLVPALALGGCTDDRGRIPSLAARPVELEYSEGITPPASAPASPPAPAAKSDSPAPAPVESPDGAPLTGTPLAARLTALEAQARDADSRFTAMAPDATRTITAAQKAPRDSDIWSAGQVALARLQGARSDTAIPLADLDTMASEAAIRAVDHPEIQGDVKRIEAVRDAVAARLAAQDALLGRLHG